MELGDRLRCRYHSERAAFEQCERCGDYLCEMCVRERAGVPLCSSCFRWADSILYAWRPGGPVRLWRILRCLSTVRNCPECGGEHHYEVFAKIHPRWVAYVRAPYSPIRMAILAFAYGFLGRILWTRAKSLYADVTCPETKATFRHVDRIVDDKNDLPGHFESVECHLIGALEEVGPRLSNCENGHTESQIIGRCESCGTALCRYCRAGEGETLTCWRCVRPPRQGRTR